MLVNSAILHVTLAIHLILFCEIFKQRFSLSTLINENAAFTHVFSNWCSDYERWPSCQHMVWLFRIRWKEYGVNATWGTQTVKWTVMYTGCHGGTRTHECVHIYISQTDINVHVATHTNPVIYLQFSRQGGSACTFSLLHFLLTNRMLHTSHNHVLHLLDAIVG